MVKPSADVNYAELYDGYWSSPDRLGEHSFSDAEAIVSEILGSLGTGRILDVGCGMGLLVQTLLAHGVDAHGVDVSEVAVDHGNNLAPGRFHLGSILELPFPDGHFDVVVSTDCLEHLSEEDVPRALAELHRVSRRGVYLRLATTPDRDGHWHLTVQQRAWWEDSLFAAGFRKHPRAMAIVPYEQLEHDSWQITLVQERLSRAAVEAYPMERLLESRYLHMDMLRETGRRSDAHVARYHLATDFVRPNDVVLDVACGLGYGSAVLAAGSEAQRVIGVDLEDYAVTYAVATTAENWPQAEFRAGDATRLEFLPDRSVDLVVSFETLEHVPDPEALLAEFHRVLKPSGRVLVSVPHMWVDETGKDPNPHHLHVYDWSKLRDQLAKHFWPEAVWSQTAGGGMKLTDAPRTIRRASLEDPTAVLAEWWLALATKSPLDSAVDDYEETSYPGLVDGERPNLTAVARDYENPWLVKSLVVRGQRIVDDNALEELAHQVVAKSPVDEGSADAGAALCVLAYRVLGALDADVAVVDDCLASIETYCAIEPRNASVRRWKISLQYVAACLLRKCGRRADASARFRRCAEMDAGEYSPILGTKTIDALLQAGLIAAADGDEATARTDWEEALRSAERLLSGDWKTFVGDPAQPLAFGLREATDLLDLAARAARALVDLPAQQQRPGKSWELMRFGLRSSIEMLERAVVALQKQNAQPLEQMRSDDLGLKSQLAALQSRVEAQDMQIAALMRMRGIKGTVRGLLDRLKS